MTMFYPALRKPSRLSVQTAIPNGVLPFAETMNDDVPAIISFSSGTSGTSKAILRTHQILCAQFAALSPHINKIPIGILCTNFPVVILLNLGLGMTTYISKAIKISALPKTDFKILYNELKRNRVTHFAFSPFIMRTLAEMINNNKRQPLHAEQLLTGGSPVFPPWVEQIKMSITAKDFTILYGSSEAEPIAACKADELVHFKDQEGVFAGRIDVHTDSIIGQVKENIFTACNAFEPGEILVSGEHVVKGYLNSETAYKRNKISIEGKIWHRTGDHGYFNTDRYLFLTGAPELIHEGLYLAEIEKRMQSIEGVKYGTILHSLAFVELKSGFDKRETELKIKEIFTFIDSVKFGILPKDKRHNGKIRYHVLKG